MCQVSPVGRTRFFVLSLPVLYKPSLFGSYWTFRWLVSKTDIRDVFNLTGFLEQGGYLVFVQTIHFCLTLQV